MYHKNNHQSAKSQMYLQTFSCGPHRETMPIHRLYGHNLDFSTFPLLVEETYRDMELVDTWLYKKLPYLAFLHGCTTALNATLIDVAQCENERICSEGDVIPYMEQIRIPGPISEYLQYIGQTRTATGENVVTNIPDIAVPSAEAGEVGGTFGPVDARSHNVYECYVSPRVTRRRIEASVANDWNWQPLGPELLPEGFTPTENFLGYGPINELNEDSRITLQGIQFPSDKHSCAIETRIQFSPQVTSLMNSALSSMSHKYKISPLRKPRKVTTGLVGFLEVITPSPSTRRLASINAHSWSSCALGPSLCGMTYLFGLHRRRTEYAPGLCGLVNGEELPTWIETRNANFEAVGAFGLTQAVDCPTLRSADHFAMGSRYGSRMCSQQQVRQSLEDSAPPDTKVYEGVSELAEPLSMFRFNYKSVRATRPIHQLYGHNLDFSTFPLLVENTYRDILRCQDSLSRELPYSAFLHGCTTALNATLIDIAQNKHLDGRLRCEGSVIPYMEQIRIPGPISEYLQYIEQTVTVTGENVVTNIPDIAVPSAEAGEVGGTFGPVDARSHNVYECYVSPRVTRRRIEASLANDRNWQPLGPELLPEGFTPTENFLGYGPIDELHVDSRITLQDIQFPSDKHSRAIETRIQFSPQVTGLMNQVLDSLSYKYKISPLRKPRKVTTGLVGFLEVITPSPSTHRLADVCTELWSSCSLEPSLCNMTYFFGLHRRRTEYAPGLCGLVNGEELPAWIETRNANFEAVGAFELTRGAVDCPKLRSATMRSSHFSPEKRTDMLWLFTAFWDSFRDWLAM